MVNWTDSGKQLAAKNKEFSRLLDLLKEASGVAIAFSGGADSTFLLSAALLAGVKSVLPVAIASDFFTTVEKERVVRLGQYLRIAPVFVSANILEETRVAQNTDRRCYFCKMLLFSKVMAEAKRHGIYTFLHGANLDDLKEFRPGMDAARELGFKAPLVDAGFSKAQIRACSKALGLETWNLPAQSCLATRIPTGDIITKEKLVKVELAETCLHGLGFSQVRVRCHGSIARIETDPHALQRFLEPNIRQEIVRTFKRAGFRFVSLDLEGGVSASGV